MDVLTSEQTQRAPSPPTVPHNDTELHDNRHYGNGKGRKSRASVLCQISTAPVNCLMGFGVACADQTLFEGGGTTESITRQIQNTSRKCGSPLLNDNFRCSNAVIQSACV